MARRLPIVVALVSMLMAGHLDAATRRPPTGAEARAVAGIEAQSRERVIALMARLEAARDAAERRALNLQIVDAKLQSELAVLRTRVAYARNRGDIASANELEQSIAMLFHPTIRRPVSDLVKAGDEGRTSIATPNTSVARDPESLLPLPSILAEAGPASPNAAGNLNNLVTFPGWTLPVVARNDNQATFNNVRPTTVLDGDAYNTYINYCWRQEGTLPGYRYTLFLDGQRWAPTSTPDPSPPNDYAVLNWGPIGFRGGRHTIASFSDVDSTVPETSEADNSFWTQYIWSPRYLSPNVGDGSVAPPDPGGNGFPYQNANGYGFHRTSGSVAWVVSAAPYLTYDDYDLAVFDDYVNSTWGYSNAIGTSRWASNGTDFVVGHYSGTPLTVYPAVSYFAGGGGAGSYVASVSEATGRNGSPDVANAFTAQSMATSSLADVYEAYFTSGTKWYFTLRRQSGPSHLVCEVFPGTVGSVHRRGEGAVSFAFHGSPNLDVLGPYTATETGWHPVVVYRDSGATAHQPVTYDFSWSPVGFVDAPDSRPREALQFLGASPNPVTEGASFGFVLPVSGRVRLTLFDVRGRQVRNLADGLFGAGRQSVSWDARDASGARLGAGVYWARFESEGQTFTRPVALMH